MIETNNNLVAIAYKAGFCGSLLYYLLVQSPEVAVYKRAPKLNFRNGTCHEDTEEWFNNLHDYRDSLVVSEDRWAEYLTEPAKSALASEKLVTFKCHPNIAYQMTFVRGLRVLYITHSNPLLSERWCYEKLFKPMGEKHYKTVFKKIFKSNTIPNRINNMLKRKFLITNINHDVRTIEECKKKFNNDLFQVKLEKLLKKDFEHYSEICNFLNITEMNDSLFYKIIDTYNDSQWKRF